MAYIRRSKLSPRQPGPTVSLSRIAVVNRTSGIGDALAMRFLIKPLAEKNPGKPIDVVLPSAVHQFIIDHPNVDRTLDPRTLRREEFEIIYDLTWSSERNLSKNRIDLWASKLGIEILVPSPQIDIERRDLERASKILKSVSPDYRPIILVCPFSSVKEKSLKPEKVNEIISMLSDFGWCPIVVHNKDKAEIDGKQVGRLNFRIWRALFYLSDIVITVATSHLWMASCFNKPTIGILGAEGAESYNSYFPNLIEYRPGCDEPCHKPHNCDKGRLCLQPIPEKIISIIESIGIPKSGSAPVEVTGSTRVKSTKSREKIGLRVQGLLGDSIRASAVFPRINEDADVIVALSYPDTSKHQLIMNLYSNLIRSGRVSRIIPSPILGNGPIQPEEVKFMRDMGCSQIYDGNVLSAEFQNYPQGEPYLGITHYDPIPKRVCLMRRSHMHDHFPLRNRPYEEWKDLEKFLVDMGLYPEILGLDDPMPNDHDLPDYRRLLTPLQTLQRCAGAELVITTATFIPVYTNHFRHTLVLSDPGDIPHLKAKWYTGNFAEVFDVSVPYLALIKNYIKKVVINE